VASSLSELRKKGIEKLGLTKECRVCTEDGTEVDDEEYFQTLTAQTVFVFARPDEEWEGCEYYSAFLFLRHYAVDNLI